MSTLSERRYLPAKELAIEIRRVLKATFPVCKFSVRIHLFSMGSAVRVRWTDGPTEDYVGELVRDFQGIGFDGRDDSTTHHDITLPSGEIVRASSYVTCSRTISKKLLDFIAPFCLAEVTRTYGRLALLEPSAKEKLFAVAYDVANDRTRLAESR